MHTCVYTVNIANDMYSVRKKHNAGICIECEPWSHKILHNVFNPYIVRNLCITYIGYNVYNASNMDIVCNVCTVYNMFIVYNMNSVHILYCEH